PLREQESTEGDPSQRAGEGPAQEDDLEYAGTEEGCVEDRHGRKVPAAVLDATACERLARVAPGEAKLGEPLATDQRDEAHVGAGGGHHRRSTSSEQKPGPMATSNPRSPSFASPESSKSRSTNRTEAEERFPTERRDSQVRASASAGRSRACSNASSTRGPPVWQMKWRICCRETPCAARKPSTSSRMRARTSCGTCGESTTLKPLSTMSQPITRSVPG